MKEQTRVKGIKKGREKEKQQRLKKKIKKRGRSSSHNTDILSKPNRPWLHYPTRLYLGITGIGRPNPPFFCLKPLSPRAVSCSSCLRAALMSHLCIAEECSQAAEMRRDSLLIRWASPWEGRWSPIGCWGRVKKGKRIHLQTSKGLDNGRYLLRKWPWEARWGPVGYFEGDTREG